MKKFWKKKTFDSAKTNLPKQDIVSTGVIKNKNKQKMVKIAKFVAITTLASAAVCRISRSIYVSTFRYFKNNDLISQVADKLDADMDIMTYEKYNDQLVRLKPNDDGKISVYIAKDIPQRTYQNIENSLDYFNNIFSNINNKYNFTIVDFAKYSADKLLQKSTIKFDYKVLDDNINAFNSHLQTIYELPKKLIAESKNNGKYCVSSTISLNKTYFDKEEYDDSLQRYTIRHELLHSFGFNDVYTKITDFSTLMNVENMSITNEISPSDMSRLFIAYCDDYVNDNNTINYEKLDEIKDYLSEYQTTYFTHIADTLKKAFNNKVYDFSNEELRHFGASYGLLDVKMQNDMQYEYVYNKHAIDPNNSYYGKGDIIKGSDFAILPKITINNLCRYYIILKDEKGLNLYDFYIKTDTTKFRKDIVMKPAIPYTTNFSSSLDDTLQK